MAQVPDERSLVESNKNAPFALIGVNTDGASDDLLKRTRDADITWRSFADGGPSGPITQAWGVTAFPTSYLLDHTGTIRGVDVPTEQLQGRIDELVVAAKEDL